MNYLSSALTFIAAGGIWVIPIIVVGAIGLGIVLERYFVPDIEPGGTKRLVPPNSI